MHPLTPLYTLIRKPLRPFRRMFRGLTLGVQAMVLDEQDQILLVRHSYVAGWHMPGGGVEWNESLLQAIDRELREETGVIRSGPAVLHGVFANFKVFPGDHVAVFIVRQWSQPGGVPEANLEIREQCFFALDELPDSLARGARGRIDEVFNNQPISETWT